MLLAEDLVRPSGDFGPVDFFEFCLGRRVVGVFVGVEFDRELAVGLLELLLSCSELALHCSLSFDGDLGFCLRLLDGGVITEFVDREFSVYRFANFRPGRHRDDFPFLAGLLVDEFFGKP